MQAQVVKKLDAAAMLRRAEANARRVQLEAAEEGARFARALCPVSDNNAPGHVHLRDTIRVEVGGPTGDVTLAAGDEAKGVRHALHVEFGTVFRAPSPYFLPGLARAKRRLEDGMRSVLRG